MFVIRRCAADCGSQRVCEPVHIPPHRTTLSSRVAFSCDGLIGEKQPLENPFESGEHMSHVMSITEDRGIGKFRDPRFASHAAPLSLPGPGNDQSHAGSEHFKDVPKHRRLAAVLAADVAGYSRLMGTDESGTLARLQSHWDTLVEPTIRGHHARIIKIAGDGILAEFASVVDAVECAVKLQRDMVERNAGIAADARIEFRMGINVGDIIIDRGDMWGDGVNVAARLEALAAPGGVCVSARVHEDVQGKLALAFEDTGEHRLKNIARPVRVYRIVLDETALPAARSSNSSNEPQHEESHSAHRHWPGQQTMVTVATVVLCAAAIGWWLFPWPKKAVGPGTELAATFSSETSLPSPVDRTSHRFMSILVLPFLNLSGDPQQDRISDGVTDSLTTDLSRAIPGSFVVSRDTAFAYKGKAADVRQIGRELNVRYVLEGSVLSDGDVVRVNSQLVDAGTGGHLWAERFDLRRSDVLEVQDNIVGRLSRAIGLKMIESEARRSERERAKSPEAHDLVLRAKEFVNRPTSKATMAQARQLFVQALEIEGDNAEGLAGVATTHIFEVLNGYHDTGNANRLDLADTLLTRALAIDPHALVALKGKAALLRAQGRFDEAITAAEAVIVENPGEPWAYKEIGLSNMYLGRIEQSLGWFAKADRFGPRDPGRWSWLDSRGHALILLGRDLEAIRFLRMALDANPNGVSPHSFLAAAYALIGRVDEAREEVAKYARLRPGEGVASFRRESPVPLRSTSASYQQRFERVKEGLRSAGMPEQAEAPRDHTSR
jgi:adenylate cyclase